jgi:hypothetical protein
MHISRSRAAVIATAVGASVAATTGFGWVGASAQPRVHSSAPAVVIPVTIKKHVIVLASGNNIQAGRTIFNVTTHIKHGAHTLQLLRLHAGYTATDLQRDLTEGIESDNPNLKAVRRLDHRVTWLGGATSTHGSTEQFGAALRPGNYLMLDLSPGGAVAQVKVFGPRARRAHFGRDATVIGTRHDSWRMPKVLSTDSWIRLRNTSDEAHFFSISKVKKSTDGHKIRRFIKHGGRGNPSWLEKPSTQSGVFSHHTNVAYHLQLPRGKYLVACYWPSDETGMPHFAMGMWKLIHLR